MLIPVVLAVAFVVFGLMSISADPTYIILGDEATPEDVARVRSDLGLDDPIFVRFFNYMLDVVQGNLGYSFMLKRPVSVLYQAGIPYTIILALAALAVNLVIGIPIGIYSALHRGRWSDAVISTVSMFGMAMPNFWLGVMLIYFFALQLGWLPPFGATDPLGIVMPALTLGISMAGHTVRTVRSAMLDVIKQDYLNTARAKGMPRRKVVWRHALRNALIPIVTVVGGQMAGLFGGTVVVETVFSWPGIGKYIVSGIKQGDYPTVTGLIIVITIVSTVILLLVDIVYAFVDPRIKAQYSRRRT